MERWLGKGKLKKPAVEAKHVAQILEVGRPKELTYLQWLQAKAVLMVGWEMFTRPADFEEFQLCDFVRLDKGMRVWVRYAKND